MNIVRLNTVSLAGGIIKKGSGGGGNSGGGGGDSDAPDGYETFDVTDGVFEVTEGELYVKL